MEVVVFPLKRNIEDYVMTHARNTHKKPRTAPGSYQVYKAHSFPHILSFLPAPIPREMTPYLGSQVSPKAAEVRRLGFSVATWPRRALTGR